MMVTLIPVIDVSKKKNCDLEKCSNHAMLVMARFTVDFQSVRISV